MAGSTRPQGGYKDLKMGGSLLTSFSRDARRANRETFSTYAPRSRTVSVHPRDADMFDAHVALRPGEGLVVYDFDLKDGGPTHLFFQRRRAPCRL